MAATPPGPSSPGALCLPLQMTVLLPPKAPGASTSSRRIRRQRPGHSGSGWRSASQPRRTRWVCPHHTAEQAGGAGGGGRQSQKGPGSSCPPGLTDTAGEGRRGSSRAEAEPGAPAAWPVPLLRPGRGVGVILAPDRRQRGHLSPERVPGRAGPCTAPILVSPPPLVPWWRMLLSPSLTPRPARVPSMSP